MDGGVPATFTVVRVGDGGDGGALSSAAAPVFLEQRQFDGTLVMKANNPLALPTAPNGNNLQFTVSGSSTSEGSLSLSQNGSYLTLAGYAANVGTAAVATTMSSAVNRVIARVDAAGNINTSTHFDAAFSTSNIRGATTTDGSVFWASGTGAAGTAGVQYITLGALNGTQILGMPNNCRWIQIFANQLYADANSGTTVSVFTVGNGLPTMAGQTATPLPGLPVAAGPSPYGFALLDRNPAVPGVDTLYLADDRTQAAGGGVQKWTFDGAMWTLATTFTQGITTGVRGLAATVTGNNVTVIVTTAEANQPNNVAVFVDDGNLNPMGMVVATAAANTVFRGVAISPQ